MDFGPRPWARRAPSSAGCSCCAVGSATAASGWPPGGSSRWPSGAQNGRGPRPTAAVGRRSARAMDFGGYAGAAKRWEELHSEVTTAESRPRERLGGRDVDALVGHGPRRPWSSGFGCCFKGFSRVFHGLMGLSGLRITTASHGSSSGGLAEAYM